MGNLRSGDAKGYQRFYNFLRKCEKTTKLAQWNQLNTLDVICMLLLGHTRDKWARHVLNIRRSQLREPNLVDFIEFVKHETFLVNDPLFSESATDQYCERASKGSQQNTKHKGNKLTMSL